MSLTRYNRYNNSLTSAFDKLFDFDSMLMPLSFHSHNETTNTIPKANVYKNDSGYSIELAVPGYSRDEFVMNVENGVLSVSISTTDGDGEQDNIRRREWSYNSFTRSFTLPEGTNVEQITARYEAGVLYVDIPVDNEREKKAINYH